MSTHASREQTATTSGRAIYVVTTAHGFTESFDARTVVTLVDLGLIRHDRDGHVLVDRHGNGVGPLHHFYVAATP